MSGAIALTVSAGDTAACEVSASIGLGFARRTHYICRGGLGGDGACGGMFYVKMAVNQVYAADLAVHLRRGLCVRGHG